MKSNQVGSDSAEPAFRRLLQAELARRCADNERYSLRAFARDLGTDHSTLSQLLRERRTLTEQTIRRFGVALGLGAAEVDEHVLREARRPPAAAEGGTVRFLRELTEDTLAVITGFEHYAILELCHLDDFCADVRWIARVLGLDPDVVNVALQRLLRLGLLEMVAPDQWVDRTGDLTNVLGSVAYEAVHRLSERARAHALEAARSATSACEYSSTTLAVDGRQLPEALRILGEARDELLRILAGGSRRDHVIQLDLSLLPLTRQPPSSKGTEDR